MNKLIIKIILAIAIGVIVGTISGNRESNKIATYFMPTYNASVEISKERYEHEQNNTQNTPTYKKISFNKELGLYYGAITSSSLIILLLIPSLMKKQED